MKKAALLLCFVLLFLNVAGCSSSDSNQWASISLFGSEAAFSETDLGGATGAVAVTVNDAFGGIELNCVPEGDDASVTVAVYRADTDYQTSVSASPVRKTVLKRMTGNLLWRFRTLPAGDYIIVFSQTNRVRLIKSVVPSDAANGKTLCYRNSEIATDGVFALTLLLSENGEENHSYLSAFAYPVPAES